VKQLCRDQGGVISIVAPVGYGKTTLLAQWALAEPRPVAWISVDARDSDPFVLLEHVVAALDDVEPLDRRLLASLAGPRRPAWPPTLDRAARALASATQPFVLVLDNADLLDSQESRSLLSMLIARAPLGSTVALAGRTPPKLTATALHQRGELHELGVEELALSRREGRLLLQGANADLPEQETADLIELCEGWAAALYLASLSFHDGTATPRPHAFGGSDRNLADYIRGECLSHLRLPDLRFLRRASILTELSGPLCDAVLQERESGRELRKLARSGVILVPLDGRRGSYRCHHLLRDLLRRDLLEEEPQLIPVLHRRAADWYEAAGDLETTLEHAEAAGDADRVAAIITATALPRSCGGGVVELERCLARFNDAPELGRYPAIALHEARIHAYRGRAADAEQRLEIAERAARRRDRRAAALRPRIAVVRAALCRHGVRRMLGDAGLALAGLPRESQWYPAALHLRGTAAMLLGALDEAAGLLGDAAQAAEALGYAETPMIATSQLSLLASARGDRDAAETLAAAARKIGAEAEIERYPTYAIALAASAGTSLRHGRWAEARECLAAAEPLRPFLTHALPWLAVATRLELARCYLTLRDVQAARAVMVETDGIFEVRPRLGALGEEARALRNELGAATEPGEPGPIGLTRAELRLLPLLATHLSFREIAEQLEVSRNTVKTQAISIYRKLGVSGRSEAIAAAESTSSKAA
jgi:LuxR family maltose regulon positive regulatory protein